MTTALYLAHLNPVTNAHVEIIDDLKSQADKVMIMPVIFMKRDAEVNSKSFPFTFKAREEMLRAAFGDTVSVSRNYTFHAPFSKYMPPLISPGSWRLRRHILNGIEDDYFTYTGDKAEGYMLKLYRLKPRVGNRKEISASSVKDKIYEDAQGMPTDWRNYVPDAVSKIIEANWDIMTRFAKSRDSTMRVAGMKFPSDGWI